MSETSLTYGLNSGGFVRMRLPEVRQSILNELKNRTGYDFDDSPNSFTGQLISVFAEEIAKMWEMTEAAYLSAYPATAQGLPMDYAVSYAGVKRLEPVQSRADVYVFGAPGAVAPAGTVIQAVTSANGEDTPPRFILQYDVTCTKTKAIGAQLVVNFPVVAGAAYWVEISGVRSNYVAINGQSPDQVAQALDSLLGNLSTATGNGQLTIFSPKEFVIDYSSNFKVNYIASTGVVLAETSGPTQALARSIRKILNAPIDIIDIYNPNPAIAGQIFESDDKLRLRYKTGVYQLGAATAPSIYANLSQNIVGISSAKLLVNNKDTVDANGLPGHSIELIVEGGDNQDIFNEIHRVKAAGITAVGNTSGSVRGEDGYSHLLSFSRPEIIWIWVKINYTVNPEQPVTEELSGEIVKAIVNKGNTLSSGEDVIIQSLESAPFSVTNSLKRVTVTIASTFPNAVAPTTYNVSDVVINPRQKANFDTSRIIIQ